jgi:hypothetical protein
MDTKHPLTSKTIWGILILLVFSFLAQKGINILPAEQQQILDLGGQLVGTLLAIYGRWKADRPLALKGPPPTVCALLVCLFPAALFIGSLTGCQLLSKAANNPDVQAAALDITKNVAISLLKTGLHAVASGHSSAAPYALTLEENIPFAMAASPDATAANLKTLMAKTNAPPAAQAELLATMRDALKSPPPHNSPGVPAAPAESDQSRAYRLAVAGGL